MNFFEMAEVYAFNNARRERLLNKAKAQGSKLEQIGFVVDYFLSLKVFYLNNVSTTILFYLRFS